MNFMKLNIIILFDLDGVILNTEAIYLKLMLEYNKKINIPITKKYYIKNLLGKTKKEISYCLSQKFKEKFNYNNYWRDLEEIRNNYLLNNKIEIKSGFLCLKKFLEQSDCKFAIVTSNSKKLTKQLLLNAGLNPNDFSTIISRDNVIKTKPSPDLYFKAISFFGSETDKIIAIEDSKVGIRAALNARIQVINFKDIDIIDPKIKLKCLAHVKSLEKVIDILKEMKN